MGATALAGCARELDGRKKKKTKEGRGAGVLTGLYFFPFFFFHFFLLFY